MTAYTPAPWLYGELSESIIGSRGQPIAQFDYSRGRLPDDELAANIRVIIAAPLFVKAAQAAIAYDAAIEQCANSPESMASFCTAEGDDLDALYAAWITASREALQAAGVAP